MSLVSCSSISSSFFLRHNNLPNLEHESLPSIGDIESTDSQNPTLVQEADPQIQSNAHA